MGYSGEFMRIAFIASMPFSRSRLNVLPITMLIARQTRYRPTVSSITLVRLTGIRK